MAWWQRRPFKVPGSGRPNCPGRGRPTRAQLLRPNVTEWVTVGSPSTPTSSGIPPSEDGFDHKTLPMERRVRPGKIHVNGIENFWALLKRAIKGTQTHRP